MTVIISGSEVVGEIGKRLASLTKTVVKDIFLCAVWTRSWEKGRAKPKRPRLAMKEFCEEVRVLSKFEWDFVEM